MNPNVIRGFAVTVAACAGIVTQPALAQTKASGPYAVARAGVQVDADLRLPKTPKTGPAAAGQTPAPSIMPQGIDAKPGFTGELGMGYDFGGFRLEGTVGYDTASVNTKRLAEKGFRADGRVKSLDIGVAGYVDLNPGGSINPFLGGGIGASRVDATASRLIDPAPATAPAAGARPAPSAGLAGTRINSRDWGFRWHLDAGVAFALTPETTLELAGRYTRTSSLTLNGTSSRLATATVPAITTTQSFKTRASSTSLMLGIRQAF